MAIAWLIASLLAALTPCLVPRTAYPHRLLAALVAVAILVKLYDLFRQPLLAQSLTLPSYISYLANWFWLVLRKPPGSVPVAEDLRQLVFAVPPLACVAIIWRVVFAFDYSNLPFALEHSAKVTTLVATIILIANCSARIWRLCGGRALEPMLNPAAARTPADFWRRWNRPAQQFFQEYAFRASGGFHDPVRGIFVAFLVSGFVHEYVFGITTGRLHGWQLLYFALNGVATVATFRIRPRGWLVLPFVAGTIAFNLALSIFFFKSVNSMLPLYSSRT